MANLISVWWIGAEDKIYPGDRRLACPHQDLSKLGNDQIRHASELPGPTLIKWSRPIATLLTNVQNLNRPHISSGSTFDLGCLILLPSETGKQNLTNMTNLLTNSVSSKVGFPILLQAKRLPSCDVLHSAIWFRIRAKAHRNYPENRTFQLIGLILKTFQG